MRLVVKEVIFSSIHGAKNNNPIKTARIFGIKVNVISEIEVTA
jgi:hypothetical protein